jgi:hypothetical protein
LTLFRHLHDDAFLAFSRDHKHLYAACLLDLHERFFSGAPSFPTPQQVVHAIYDVMRANPVLWNEGDDFGSLPEMISARRRRIRKADVALASEKGDKALGLARQLYARLLVWGWLEEEEYGLRVTVDMAMGPLLVLQRLASLNKDLSQRFGGLIVQIRLNLEAVEKLRPEITDRKQREAALAVREARNQADQFTKSLRAILADLKRVRRTVMESKTVATRLEAFFEEFIEQLLLKDFESILTVNHPYRFRDAIVDLARRISYSPETMQVLAEEYIASSMAADIEDGRMAAADDLLAIESIFDQIGEMFDRIEAFRRQLEARVRNTIKYAERGGTWCGAWMPYCATAGTTRRQSNGASSRCGRPGRSTIRRRPGSRAVPSKQGSSPSRRRIRCMNCARSSASSTSLASRPAPRMSDDSSRARCRHSRPGKPASWKSIPWTTFSPSIAPADMR